MNLAYSSGTARRRSASRVLAQPQGQAHRVPLPGPELQPVPGVRGDADGGASTASRTRSSPGEPLDKDIYDLEPEELAKVPKTPGSLDEALDALEKDHEFLLQGDVFTADVIEHLDLVQAREGSRRDPPAAASVRVLLVLRHLEVGRVGMHRRAAPLGAERHVL